MPVKVPEYAAFGRPMLVTNIEETARIVRDVFIWGTVAITVISGILYIQRAVTLYQGAKRA